jgi:hypothetical protein
MQLPQAGQVVANLACMHLPPTSLRHQIRCAVPTARSGIGENQEQPSFFRIPGHLSVSNPHSRRHGISGNLAELNALLFVAHLSSRPAAQRWLRGRSEAHPIDNDNDAADEKRIVSASVARQSQKVT